MESQNGQDVEDARWRKFWGVAGVIGSSGEGEEEKGE